jgi:hypothetical protein
MKTFWFAPVCFAMVSGCTTVPRQDPILSVEDHSDQNLIRISNRSGVPARISYSYSQEFGSLQMFLVRFRDRNRNILPIVYDAEDGWFTPKVHSASLSIDRRRLIVPPGSSIDFPRDIAFFAQSTQWAGARDRGPCEVQIKLSGFLDDDRRRPIEAVSDWRPGPCPM